MTRLTVAPGVFHWPGRLTAAEQGALLAELRAVVRQAPFFQPRMPKTGKPFSVRMTNCGPLGWVSDVDGYRYQPLHPETKEPWPLLPAPLLALWGELSGYAHPPEACLVNHYAAGAKMGLHQDRDEQDFDAPVLSVSLGDAALFRIGGATRGGRTTSLKLSSGDVLLFGGEARLAYHGIDRILSGSSTLLPEGGRINLTLRRVTKPG
ncbi:MAG: alpha-ketoglutarate-dependent dioxygenase AlkB family protein [Bosea sp. (in: a-proteobacteria)]|uniref:alpha-ketoglutarate-dependent dioxygenase AlkB family protein n=1 Tax=unclassified Bosea (in: a-proteobacteria) TaxID=2653178 RepID=UPI0009628E75|nr:MULTISPECIES: alpha-ketoglutarate-dependent dioxygenase AlkB [unclassified Bosea (in: a-proteobacteria)]MBN9442060.1 alpha-ketoglutarate-dependent dioxygenase AlkB [Bosea sp. (in: a-proteobacteria)]MBN9459154.1 alpha-ketoglutarate-dependent dioxygenase AlkB [Bosea sp. (in: a-proteobacteria)]OJV06497.1 MAG: alkylated DNA repair dioxygenase [Bosea sp. 67-29]